MKEVIAKRSRKFVIFMSVVGIIGLLNGIFWRVESMKWMGIFCIAFNAFVLAFVLYMVITAHPNVIEKSGEQLILHPPVRKLPKVIVNIADIQDVVMMQDPQMEGKQSRDAISIIAIVDGNQITHDCIQIANASAVLEKLKTLIDKE